MARTEYILDALCSLCQLWRLHRACLIVRCEQSSEIFSYYLRTSADNYNSLSRVVRKRKHWKGLWYLGSISTVFSVFEIWTKTSFDLTNLCKFYSRLLPRMIPRKWSIANQSYFPTSLLKFTRVWSNFISSVNRLRYLNEEN